ncbi:hypothetical protein [Pseudonocardia sp. NPDC049635]|uniref:hypothetical protein n=1 Tax=Pseudonocardia sp. NPDC049635 TaxID=3155506 RepID=UPI0033CF8CF2
MIGESTTEAWDDRTFEVSRFHTRGRMHTDGAGARIVDQIYVERIRPTAREPLPRIVCVHGTDQTGLCFLRTADGRPGWAYDFAQLGWEVYVVDQVARGRSVYDPAVHGPLTRLPLGEVEALFTGAAAHHRFPRAGSHARWPGGPGVSGNPAFDAFATSQVASLADVALAEELNTRALTELFDSIGGAVLLTHSQASVFGFQLCDHEPDLVHKHITIEPNGPPFHDIEPIPSARVDDAGDRAAPPGRPWGITRLPLTYEPATRSPDELRSTRLPGGAGLRNGGWLQQEPARTLPRLARTPQVVVSADASFRSDIDGWTHRFLVQAGVPAVHLRLSDHGFSGNGHMMMQEENSVAIARLLSEWARRDAPSSILDSTAPGNPGTVEGWGPTAPPRARASAADRSTAGQL